MTVRYVKIDKVVDKYNRRYSADEYEAGITDYVNDPNFDALYTEQINKAVQGYQDAGAPTEWAAMQELGLSLVSADDWKQAVTDPATKTAYENGKVKAVRKLQKKGIIFVEQDNLVLDILDIAGITDKANRMLVPYVVGTHFKKAIALKLRGLDTDSDTELENMIKELDSRGICDTYDDTNQTLTALGTSLLDKAKDHRDTAVTYLLGQ